MDRTLSDDPYPLFETERRIHAVGVDPTEDHPTGRRAWYSLYTWDAVHQALTDPAFDSTPYDDSMGLSGRYARALIATDGADHRSIRALLQPVFARSSVHSRDNDQLRIPLNDLLDSISARRSADLWPEFCQEFPRGMLAHLLGLPTETTELLAAQANVITGSVEEAIRAADLLFERLLPEIDRYRTKTPADRVNAITLLAQGAVGGEQLTDHEVFTHLRLLAIAGSDTLSRAAGNVLVALLSYPTQWSAIRRDPTLVPAAVDEAIRWQCPAVTVPRFAAKATEVAGVPIPGGAAVRCHLGSANHDPSRWPSPERFNLHRPRRPNAGFGLGPHACLGSHLARHLLEQMLHGMLRAMPDVRLDPKHPRPAITGFHVREPDHLRVLVR